MFAFCVFMIGLVIVLSFAAAILNGIVSLQDGNYVKKTFDQLLQEKNIITYQHIRTIGNQILIDDKDRDVLYVIHNKGWVSRSYSRVTDVELSIDDSIAFQSSLSSATGRVIVGGVLAGGVGAIIGGVTGKKNGKKVVHRITLTISFNTPDIPYVRVTFLDNKQGVDIYSDQYEGAERDALYWSELISSLMR
ncbi:hypothetical protein QRE63_01505 [Bacillus mycoides]|uniref:hypothetical protein n=1 Tax=Bacillus mycoides TaxID=1405 RepID=UPI002570E399|nr:hypothetical protein [Bacillus mycoides]WJE64682.1 hypothetical protein QRE63_01505 [Bacillus mycoides]